MPSPNDGGPAFPIGQEIDACGMARTGWHHGMSLRAYFAAHAMQGILGRLGTECCAELVATWAVQNADALIAELSKPSRGGS